MRRKIALSLTGIVAVAGLATGVVTANAASWVFTSSDKWATYSEGGYGISNDVWGSGAGTQTLSVNSHNDWQVVANHPNTGGVKSYPHVYKSVDKKLSALKSVSSSFSVNVPSAGAYESAYDIWADNYADEIMLWMNKHGAVGPIGSKQLSVTVGGHSWDVYKGSNGKNAVFSFVRTSNTSSGTVDVLAVLKWIKSKGWFGDVTLGHVEWGFEITSSAGGLTFANKSYSVTSS